MAERADQLEVGGLVVRLAARNGQREHARDDRHQTAAAPNTARQPKCPATTLEIGRDSRMPSNSPLMMVPTTLPRDLVRREVGGERNQDLHGHGTEADQQRDHEEPARRMSEGRGAKARDRHQRGGDHQLAVFQQVAERHEEEQAERVADLRERNDQAGGAAGHVDVRRDQFGDRLRVVEIRDDRAAAEGEQRDQAARQPDAACATDRRGCLNRHDRSLLQEMDDWKVRSGYPLREVYRMGIKCNPALRCTQPFNGCEARHGQNSSR